jgi:glycosyltransferase involved in cell wall biosynthesis
MPADRVFVVRSGPSLERMRVVPPDENLKCGRRFLVGYVGVMGKQEGIDDLLQAVRYIVHEMGRHDIHFGLVGGGTSLAELKALAVQLGVASYVTFTGRVPDAALLAMLNTADVCVNPDKPNPMNDLSTMNKIMEYMALGKPIVQYDLKEGRFSAQQASLYARCDDVRDLAAKIVQLVDDPQQRAAMGRFGRERVLGQLQWRHSVPQLLEAYAALWPTPAPVPEQQHGNQEISTRGGTLASQPPRLIRSSTLHDRVQRRRA